MTIKKFIILLVSLSLWAVSHAQQSPLLDSLHYRVEMQATLASGDYSPLWLNANKYGLSSLDTSNGYVRGALERPLALDGGRRWGLGFGADMALTTGFTSRVVVQQAYVEGRWLKGVLTVGAKQQPMMLKDAELSTGSQTLGINARPIPEVRVALPDYWAIPGTHQWLALKGHIAYGVTTDDDWQKSFTLQQGRYTEHTLFHSKAGYLKIGKHRLAIEAGLEMATQFGGSAYILDDGAMQRIENEGGLKGMVHALLMGGTDATDGDFKNNAGNHVGSWLLRVNYDADSWRASVYVDHFFEDQSSLFQMGYNGYGEGSEWHEKKESRFWLYDFKDMLLGMEVELKDHSWLSHLLVEYIYTKYQCGGVYHDHTASVNTHLCGRDNYYNHHLFTGWQHWGQVIGNPLYRSPLYNTDGVINVDHNRFYGWHVGIKGSPLPQFHYRLLATWQKSFGSYYYLPMDPEENTSLLAEATWRLPKGGWQLAGALAVDAGRLRGDNWGLQLTIAKEGWLSKKGRR